MRGVRETQRQSPGALQPTPSSDAACQRHPIICSSVGPCNEAFTRALRVIVITVILVVGVGWLAINIVYPDYVYRYRLTVGIAGTPYLLHAFPADGTMAGWRASAASSFRASRIT